MARGEGGQRNTVEKSSGEMMALSGAVDREQWV